MTTFTPAPGASVARAELESLRAQRIWFLLLGLAMAAAGTFAIGWACTATVTVTAMWLFGFILLGSGLAEIVHSFWVGRWSGMIVHLLLGVLYVLVGFLVIDQPENAAVQVTLLIAIFLMVSGVFRIILSVSEQFTGWGWVLLNGAVTFFLGLMIYKQWPASSLWVIGLFIGIDLIFNGWAWIGLWFGLRRLPPPVQSA
jgi:uncharacterized membrane protein HdeD (DUF308 family)